ncbi:putative FBD-associated F-box protein At1g61330 [Beta vulgaris subsp. vulgaris]|uniref:putative FBD-associated F-box protein At1g61330 n=1 Tax=Beta vulgaris subsp. vulgaris TaxID=3555 RepID=UPI002546B6B9|nr:putative FBD-associated F-box protein At1g61330 [Beta vulgaris subsp. vulgaris]
MESNSIRDEDYPPGKKQKYLCNIIDQAQNTLTNDVIDHIISLLPIKNASQTSILSKRFEKSWQHCKHLCFDYMFSRNLSQKQVASIVNRILMLHSSTKIDTFHICISSRKIEALIVTWLKLVISKNPKVLNLDFFIGKSCLPNFEVPFDLLDIESIETLGFSYCNIELPPKFKGLHFLRTLVLRHIKLNSSFIKTIIYNCPLLECLDIVKCHNINHIEVNASALKFFKVLKIRGCYQLDLAYITAPTLNVLHFVGKPNHVILGGKMMELKDVMLHIKIISYIFPRRKIKDLILKISHVRVLTITSTLLEVWILESELETTIGPKPYLWHLKEVQLLMETTSLCNPYDLVCFIDKCPVLERLFIDKFTFDGRGHYWTMHDSVKFDQYDKKLSFLKLVKISNFNFHVLELKLVKFFLEKALNLENLAIFTMKNYSVKKFSTVTAEFLQHLVTWKSSPRAKVGIYEHCDKEDDVLVPMHRDL